MVGEDGHVDDVEVPAAVADHAAHADGRLVGTDDVDVGLGRRRAVDEAVALCDQIPRPGRNSFVIEVGVGSVLTSLLVTIHWP